MAIIWRKIGQIMPIIEDVQQIEPALLEEAIPTRITDLIADLTAAAAGLGRALHPRSAANLADAVRMMNTYYSNLIEGHNTRPRDIERALKGDFDNDKDRRNLQLEATAHIRLQAEIDALSVSGVLSEPASGDWLRSLHREFYKDAPKEMLVVRGAEGSKREIMMVPGEWRSSAEQDVEVGLHLPPSSERVAAFMEHFERRFRMERMGTGQRLIAMACAHHRFNYIHPFPDGNGRISRLMSYAMAHKAGIGAHGLWSISRGLARGLESRAEYKRYMQHADSPRQGDRDGRGNLSLAALTDFTEWFLKVCLDQITFMGGLFELGALARRLRRYADLQEWKPEAGDLLQEALMRGEFDRGDAPRITRLPERTARRVLKEVTDGGLLASDTEKGPVSLRFPAKSLDILFPALYPEA
ncbi:Fic family protein [Sphingomonas canadensis]|uniref:Fic family protein n=1 Tax=Sphingomonas canadensis TaxID=1219257 RepID=A0ABW3H700_9SPHN|nr:Fic family protein [Sphingomonas canadensis]MCW3837079.1 Fic family protein [Sphingomonas canadensis]